MAQLFSNNAIARLASNISPIATSIFIDPARANLFPNPTSIDDWFLITLDNINDPDDFEIVKISHRTGNQLHVAERGYEGSAVGTWAIADTICDHRVTAGTLSTFLPVTALRNIQAMNGVQRVVDQFLLTTSNKVVKWHISLNCDNIDKVQSFELSVLFKDFSTAPKWSKFAVLGDKINYSISVDITSGNLAQLKIQHSEADVMSINATRIQLT